MRIISSILLVVLPFTVSAFDFQNMGSGDMQQMMKNLGKMQTCISKISQKEMDDLAERSEKYTTSIKSLCKKGLRAEAQEKAMSYSKEFVNNSTIKKMEKCGEMAKGMMPDTFGMFSEEGVENMKVQHVCDSIDE